MSRSAMLTKTTAVLLCCAGWTTHALATDIPLPSVDVETECRAGTTNGVHSFNDCVDQNQGAYDSLKFIWPDTPEPVKRQAIAWTNSNPKLRPVYYQALYEYVIDLRQMYDHQHATPHHFEK